MPRAFLSASIVRVLSLAILSLCAPCQAAQTMTLGTINNFTSRVNGIVLHEVYRRLGIELDIVMMPPSRVTAMSDSGLVDGEVNRIKSYGAQHPTLIRVEPALNYWTVAAFYRAGAPFEIHRAAELGGRQLGIVRGIKASADLTAGMSNVNVAPSSRELMLMLNGSRFEVAIDGENESGYFIRKLGLQSIISVPLEKHALYHYVHEKNKQLVPLISREIEKMTESGELMRIYNKAVSDLMANGSEL